MFKKLIILLICLFLSTSVYAGTATQDTVYSTGGSVTANSLNNNWAALGNELNGGLDNNNADTANGYRFYEIKGSLPTAGTQGRTVYLTTDDTLYFDNSSSWSAIVTSTGTPANGDIIYYNSGWQLLNKGTAGEVLTMNSGATLAEWQPGVPIGGIIMWNGSVATIPSGWELCDGTCSISCPDLRDKFVVGAKQDDSGTAKTNITGSLTQSGGSTTIAEANLPAHTHTIATQTGNSGGSANYVQRGDGSGSLSTLASSSVGSGTAYTQPYYALAYIIKVE